MLKPICLALLAAAALPLSAQEHLKSLDKSGFDPTVKASEDFYTHVNSGWMKNHQLTPEYARYGQFNILQDSSNNRVRSIVANLAASNPAKGTNAYKVASLYELAMDSVRRNKLGADPVKPILKKIEATPHEGMTDLFLEMQKDYFSPFVGVDMMEDLADSRQYAMYVGAAGLGLGDRDYYLLNDKRNKDIRDAYTKLIEKVMTLSGYSKKDAARIARNVIKIETLMADSTWTREESRNTPAMYNPRPYAAVKEMYPNVPFDRMFADLGITPPETLILTTMNTIKQGNDLMASLTDREIKDYYLAKVAASAASALSDDYSDAMFEFAKALTGVSSQQPRWKRALGAVEGSMGEAVGQLYVEKYFPQSSKDYMVGLVENLRNALGKHIIDLPWMSTETKLNAIKKLQAITVKIGYPDQWKDYSELTIDPSLSYYDNVRNVGKWAQKEQLKKWGKPVDRAEWAMTPQTINAYYNPVNNEIVFPAGILQAPFFDPQSSDAENYGGIGVVIGHELTHGFDDQGSMFDADGNMVNWWTPEDAAAFRQRTQALVDQYSAVELFPGVNANGEFTQGENIADHGGLRIARTAFLDAQKKKGVDVNSPEAQIDGLDPNQVFYLNYANIWAQNIRDEEARRLTIGDTHSLSPLRVNVALRNLDPFFEAFGIKEGDKMWRPVEERITIW